MIIAPLLIAVGDLVVKVLVLVAISSFYAATANERFWPMCLGAGWALLEFSGRHLLLPFTMLGAHLNAESEALRLI